MTYIEHRLSELSRSVQILRETVERRLPPDEVIDSCIVNLDVEVALLKQAVTQEVKES